MICFMFSSRGGGGGGPGAHYRRMWAFMPILPSGKNTVAMNKTTQIKRPTKKFKKTQILEKSPRGGAYIVKYALQYLTAKRIIVF